MCTHRMPRTYLTYTPYKKMRTPKAVTAYVKKMEPTFSAIRWLCWFEPTNDGADLLARVFAAQKTKARGVELYEVMRETIGGAFYLQRNIYYERIPGWKCWFPAENDIIPDEWQAVPVDRMPGVLITLLNPDDIFTVEKFKFCGYKGGFPLAPYLRMYLEEPGVEFFGKMKMKPTKALVNKAKKDPNFRKYLRKLTPEQIAAANIEGPAAVLKAYEQKTADFYAVGSALAAHRSLSRKITGIGARAAMRAGWSAEKIREYMNRQGIEMAYGDYIKACEYLGLNLKDTKTAFPREFRRMHDMRIDEMHSKQAAEKKEQLKELYKRFAEVAETVKPYEYAAGGLAVIIPTDAGELIAEGEALKHCVGRMGYDVKEAERRSFIAFVRQADEIGRPFVTVEFDFKTKKVRQCYGAKDSAPPHDVRRFVDEWAAIVAKGLQEQEKAEEERRRLEEIEAAATA